MLEPCSGVASSLALICSDQILPYAILQLDLTVNFYKAPRLPHIAPLRLFDKAVPVPILHSKPARTRVETLVARSFSSPSQVKFGG